MSTEASEKLISFHTQEEIRQWREAIPEGDLLGFVPTMGALHKGHIALVHRAVAECSHVAVSVFVNPLQFSDSQDFDSYPRSEEADSMLLAAAGAEVVYLPRSLDMEAAEEQALLGNPADVLWEGEFRPGHFSGMLTVVGEFFRQLRPTHAFFGEKDAQQLFLVREMAARFFPEINVVACETVRDEDGLALSSRNQLLSPRARKRALNISYSLHYLQNLWERGERDISELEAVLINKLECEGIKIEYAALVDDKSFQPANPEFSNPWRACVAVRVGGVRLIDNLLLGVPR